MFGYNSRLTESRNPRHGTRAWQLPQQTSCAGCDWLRRQLLQTPLVSGLAYSQFFRIRPRIRYVTFGRPHTSILPLASRTQQDNSSMYKEAISIKYQITQKEFLPFPINTARRCRCKATSTRTYMATCIKNTHV